MNLAESNKNLENELLDKFSTKINGMVKDGVVSWNDYLQSDIKILFVLKEVNGSDNWDLRAFLREGGRADTWNNITRWLMGIRNIDKELLKEQLNLYNPNLVICCGTVNEYFDFICENKQFDWKTTNRNLQKQIKI